MAHAIHFFCPGKPSSSIVHRYQQALASVPGAHIIWHTPAGRSAVFTQLARRWQRGGRFMPTLLEQHPIPSGPPTTVTLVAFSAGYGAIREILAHTEDRNMVDAVVLLDALHAGLEADGSANDAQLVGFVRYALRAKAPASDALFWVGHTDVPTGSYASTTQSATELVRLANGEGGQFQVHSYDLFPPLKAKSEHAAALTQWGPGYLSEALVPHLSALALKRKKALPWRDAALSLGERAVLWSLAQQSLGGIETAGHNAGPIIASYHRGAKRKNARGVERPVGLRSGNWCVSGLCFGERRCLLDGEQPVMPWRVSGMEMQRDAAKMKQWRSAELARTGVWKPRRGDVVIFVRPPNADPNHEWRRHVARVSEPPDSGGRYQTVDANHGDRWATVSRKLSDRALLGFVAYPRRQPEALSPEVWAHVVQVSEDVLHGRYGLEHALAGLLPQELVA